MKVRAIALTTSALVAVAVFAAPASAGQYTGKISLGAGYVWETFEDGGEGDKWDANTSGLQGAASVNVPYNDDVNIQFDIFGDKSMDNYTNGDGPDQDSFYGGFGAAAHINYRDSVGALGVFAALGRAAASTGWASDFVVFAGGLEGQYFCNAWTLRSQIGYLDSDQEGWLLQEAGFINVGADYYASNKLKLSGSVGYIDGATSGSDNPDDVDGWNWTLGVEYVFGKSIPVSTYLEYAGYSSTEQDGSDENDLDRHQVKAGVRFYFGGDGDLMKADREGAGMKAPDILLAPKYLAD